MRDVDATHATTATPGGAKAVFPPFEPASFGPQLLWFAIAFGLLYYLMSKIALPRVGAILHDRFTRIAKDLDDAQALRGESEAAVAAYEQSLTDARDKAKGIAQATRDKLAAETDARRRTLEGELADKLAGAEATIRARTDAAMSNVRGIAADAAGAIVEQLTGRPADPAAIEAALDDAMRG